MSFKIVHLTIAILAATTLSISLTPKATLAEPEQQITVQQIGSMYVLSGRKQWQDGNYQVALQMLDKAIELAPQNADAFFWRGVTYDSLKKSELAIADFDRTIVADKEYGMAYYMRGLNYSSKKDYKKAIADLEIAEKLLKAAGNDTYAEQSTQTLKMLKVLNR